MFMQLYPNPYTLALAMNATVLIFMMVAILRNPGEMVRRAFAALLLASAFWQITYGLELAAYDQETMLFWARVEYLAIVAIPGLGYIFALAFTGRDQRLTRRCLFLLFLIPAITLVMVWTNDFHHLHWVAVTWDTSGPVPVLSFTYGPWFFIYIIVAYFTVLLALMVFVQALIRTPRPYRGQIAWLVGAWLLVLGAELFTLTPLNPFVGVDLTPFALGLASIFIAWSFYRYRLFSLIPSARARVIEGMSDGVIVLDGRDTIVDFNPAAERLTGKTVAAVVEKPLEQVFPELSDVVRRNRRSGRTQVEIEMTVGEGANWRYLEVRVSPLVDQSGDLTGHVILLRDITVSRESDLALRRRDAILNAVNFAAAQFLWTDRWEQCVEDVLARLGRAANVSRVYVFENTYAADRMLRTNLRYEWVAPGVAVWQGNPAMQDIAFRAGFESWAEAFKAGEAIYGNVTDFPPEQQVLATDFGIRSLVVVPIFVGRMWWGVIGFVDIEREREWSSIEIEALGTAADILGASVWRDWVQRAEREQRVLAEALRDAASALNSTLDLDEVLDRVLDNARRVIPVPYDMANILLVEDGIARIFRHQSYLDQALSESELKRLRLPVRGTRNLREVMESGEPVVIPNIHEYRGWVKSRANEWIRSVITVPIRLKGDVIGFLDLESTEPGAFTAEHARWLQPFADQAAIAIGNARLYATAQQYAAELEARNSELDAYGHTVAHDLQNPLNLLIGYVALVKEEADALSPDAAGYLDVVERAAFKMAHMINSLLLLSRLRNAEGVIEEVAMGPVIGAALDRLQQEIEERSVQVKVADDLPPVMGYDIWLEEVLANLLSNAIKYIGRDNPDPRVTIRGFRQGELIRYEVQDNGVGIPPRMQARLFEAFSRFHEDEARGVGLGLSIVLRIINKLGGEVGVESTPGEGSTFWFMLPAPLDH